MSHVPGKAFCLAGRVSAPSSPMQRHSPPRLQTWVAFLFVNIVVSAITAFVVVRVLTLNYSRSESGNSSASTTRAAALNSPATSTPNIASNETALIGAADGTATSPAPRPRVRIASVSYPGQRSRERVVLVNEGAPVDLRGWQLVSPRGQVYTFSNVVLLSFLNVNTTRGTDTPTDLFWNLDEAVWRSGDTVTLKRGEEIIATFVVP
ncbi:MAG: hypothetical protein RML84_00870 [Anaerolineae bacterium]|nr:hypothetical protein [Anaerolineae bacterium]